MTSVVDLAKLANAVYDDVLSIGQWSRVGQPFTEHASTFKAALYQNRQTTDFSLAIAGTKALGDLKSDVQLAMGRTPVQYRLARTAYASSLQLTGGLVDFYMAGHSLGGGTLCFGQGFIPDDRCPKPLHGLRVGRRRVIHEGSLEQLRNVYEHRPQFTPDCMGYLVVLATQMLTGREHIAL